MARADYCGDGTSHTRDDTRISIYDTAGIRSHGRSDDLTFEAAWGPDGATEIWRTRQGESLAEIAAKCPEKGWVFKTGPDRIVRLNVRPLIMNDSRPAPSKRPNPPRR